MSDACIHALRSLASQFLVGGLMVALITGCHHRSSRADAAEVKDGYGSQANGKSGGGVGFVTSKELETRKAARAEELLEGRFPGVHVIRHPGGGFSIRIRGQTTLMGNQEPLYVIDGLPIEVEAGRGLDWLNPSDIQRIDVLKNATETTMYGVRGANGVIVITTKKASSAARGD